MLQRGVYRRTRWDLFPRVPVYSHRFGPYLIHAMQAIQTKYLPPTDTKGARIKATCERGTRTIPYPYELSGDSVHREAALQLIERFVSQDWKERATPPSQNPWKRAFVTGGLPDGSMAHVFL